MIVILLGVLVGLQRAILFPTWAVSAPAQSEGEQDKEQLWLSTRKGRVEAWFLAGRGVSQAEPGPLVIFAHGNGEIIDHWPQTLDHYRQLGVSVLLPEFRGYGRSGGSPSEQGIVQDYVAFYDQVTARPDVDARRVVFHGRSLGGGVVCGLAKQRKPAALILQSTFTSVADLAAEKYLIPRFLIRDPFDSVEAVRGLDSPLLIIHGRDDELIPISHAHTLRAAAKRAELLVLPGGHNDTPRSWPELWKEIDAFLESAEILSPPKASGDGAP